MNIVDFYKTNYKVAFTRILRQYWKEVKSWSCIGAPKKDHLFIYLDGCSAVYTTKDGKQTTGCSGDTLFVPKGMEYTVDFFDFKDDKSSTVNINFELCNYKGEEADDFCEITRFSSSEVRLSIMELEHLSLSLKPIPTRFDIEVYKIFNSMGDESAKEMTVKDEFEIIKKGVEYLHYHYNENTSICSLAQLCNISEVYFRRLFKKHMGVSPTKYRQILRFEKGCQYLKFSNVPITEISQMLGFVDTSYFVKSFKEHYGITPLNYRKQSL